MSSLLEPGRGGLIVSCQALPDEALFGPEIMARMAIAAMQGGAMGIRANSPEDIAAIRGAVSLPLIGLWKQELPGSPIYITPTLASAVAVADAGADAIAIDATNRAHPEGTLEQRIQAIHRETGCPVLADISTLEEARIAWESGAEWVSTTLSGYTPYSPQKIDPDFDLIEAIASSLPTPVLAEGKIASPEQAAAALKCGAFAVVVGGAITRPAQIAARFAAALRP